MSSNSTADSLLGIKNFRKEYAGLMRASTNFAPINPNTEPLTDAGTYNGRFKSLSDGIRHCFNAVGDIAIRDKRYLESFLAGYVNPMISVERSYANPAAYQNYPTFNMNGQPVTFPEDRIMYDVSSLGEIDTNNCYVWVFKNGLLMWHEDYTMVNTAYGIKCFIKSSKIAANDKINVSVNRIYNTEGKYYTLPIASSGSGRTVTIPVSNLSTFYHPKYLRLMVKRGTHAKLSFIEIPTTKYTTEIDVTGTTLKIIIFDFPISAGEKLIVYNTIHWWKKEVKAVAPANGSFDTFVETTNYVAATSDYHPVPYSSDHDFDVFFNGYHLILNRHYAIVRGGDGATVQGIKLFFIPAAGVEYTMQIYKNEASTGNADLVYATQETMNNKGVITVNDTSIPVMANLGHCFLADRYVIGTRLTTHHRKVFTIDESNTLDSFEYRARLVSGLDIDNVMYTIGDRLSESDMISSWMGFNAVVSNIAGDRPLVNDLGILGFSGTYRPNNAWTILDASAHVLEKFNNVRVMHINGIAPGDMLIDSNLLISEHPAPLSNILDSDIVLDLNVEAYTEIMIDSNAVFQ